MKVCEGCGIEYKPYKPNTQKYCKQQCYKKAWNKRNADKVKHHNRYSAHLVRTYGITQEQYDAQAEAQDHKCSICGIVAKLYVDHDHNTGAVRGLLCDKCNRGIGFLQDSADNLRSAAAYLDNGGVWHD